MCIQKFHRCKYCKHDYECDLTNNECPSFNDDINANMCSDCENELNKELKRLDEVSEIKISEIIIEEIIGNE